jgi:LacI family transcriptional regulator
MTIMTNRSDRRKRPTMRELSELTGLSTAAVSYALRGERVSPQTAERVRREADRIGFRSDPVARALRGGRTGTVGVVGGSLADYWHQEFISHLGRALRANDLQLLLADADGDPAAELALAQELADRRVDGLVVLPLDPAAPGWRRIARDTPTVSVNESLPRPARAIRFASAAGIELALGHLARRGHHEIAVLGGGPHRIPRRAGVRRTRCGPSPGEAERAAHRLLTSATRRPTAIFALSDSIAYGAYAAARELDLTIPGDVAVIGFDDHPVSRLLDPPLTAVGWDTHAAAVAAAEMIAAAVAGEGPAAEVVIDPVLAVRRST